jgi:signal transduction histidine kinase
MTAAILNSPRSSILVVDTDSANLALLSQILGPRGYEIRVARSGERALGAAFGAPPDLVLLEARMPELDGYAVCEQLKADPRTRDVPVIFVSALAEIDHKLRAFAVGAADYVCKPFEAGEVMARVETQVRLRQTEAALVQARREAEQASRAKSLFLAAMSHELRTPLHTILGFAEIIRDNILGLEGVSRYSEYAADIHESGSHLLELIDDVLDIAKIEAGQVRVERSAIELERVLRSALRLVAERADKAGVAVQAECASSLPYLFADERGVKQILFNLLASAIRLTPRGGTVSVRAAAEPDGTILLLVADPGSGIPEGQRADLNRRGGMAAPEYHRLGGAAYLGLALVKALAELQGGLISVRTDAAGSLVTVCFPPPVNAGATH